MFNSPSSVAIPSPSMYMNSSVYPPGIKSGIKSIGSMKYPSAPTITVFAQTGVVGF